MNRRLNTLKKELNVKDDYETADIKNIINAVNISLNANPQERKIYIKQKFLNAVFTAAIVFAISCITVFASVSLDWHKKLAEYFNPTDKQIEQMQGAAAFPDITATDGGITVNILQTLADKHGIYVLYEIEGVGNIGNNETLSWEKERLKISYKSDSKIPGTGGYAYSKILDCENNKCTMLYIRTGTGKIANQKLKFDLSGLKKGVIDTNGNCSFYSVSESRFELEWDFQYENLGKEWNPDEKINNGKNTVTQIDISPISLWITVSGEELKNIEGITINFKNGKTINNSVNTAFSPLHGGINTLSLEFDRIIDVNSIKSVQIGEDTVYLCN